jgi:hypothetical protein
MDLNFIIRAAIPRQLQTASIRQSETTPWNHARRTRPPISQTTPARLFTRRDSPTPFQVTVHSRRVCLTWAMRRDGVALEVSHGECGARFAICSLA